MSAVTCRRCSECSGNEHHWMDNYDASTNLQWIDVTGLAAGYYKLTVGADQNGWFEETNLNNNTTWAKIKITAHAASIVDSGGPST